jgi:DNA repair protein RadC
MVNIKKYSLRLVKETSSLYDVDKKIKTPRDIYSVLSSVYDITEEPEEVVVLVTLDIKNNVTGVMEVSRGGLNSSVLTPREVFKRAIANNAGNIILCHNHPSGDSTPSQEDIDVTKRIKDAGKIIGIDLLDHLIITEKGFCSLKEKNII